jgi:hypothetical protein
VLNLDAYLQIAETVLRQMRRPMGPRAILNQAYMLDLVPAHLHGKTQHKTLQARISEDILVRRERSAFFRTGPGKFFLRECISDVSLPEEFREPFIGKRRVRELTTTNALSFQRADIAALGKPAQPISSQLVLDLAHSGRHQFVNPKDVDRTNVLLWAFVIVERADAVLSYRLGRYRENREAFLFKRSIGFTTLIDRDDATLFSSDGLGIVEGGIAATQIDLDIPTATAVAPELEFEAKLSHFVWSDTKAGSSELIAVIKFICPSWFEPTKRRLALNDLRWFPLSTRVNQIDDFDPWSQLVLEANQVAHPA